MNIGWVGCGHHSYDLLAACLRDTGAVIAAACDPDCEQLARFSRHYHVGSTYADLTEMLAREKLDAVICAATPAVHFETARTCMSRGIPVFVEKTPCVTSAQAAQLAKQQAETGCIAMVGFNRRYCTGYRMQREIITEKSFGRVTMYMAKYHAPAYRDEATYIHNHIIHHLDLARFFLGELALTHCDRICLDTRRVGYNITFRSETGVIGVIQSGSLQRIEYPMERVEITGVERNVIVDNIRHVEYNRPTAVTRDRPALCEGSDALVWNLNHGNLTGNDENGFKDAIESFIRNVENKTPASPGFGDTLQTMLLLDALDALLKS